MKSQLPTLLEVMANISAVGLAALTVDELAEYSGMKPSTVRRCAERGVTQGSLLKGKREPADASSPGRRKSTYSLVPTTS